MILLIDNYDSFAHNLARYFTLAGQKCRVVRNDAIGTVDIADMRPDALVLSPGPCTPAEAGICTDAVRSFGAHIPILGVCLGHQCIGEAYGAPVIPSSAPMHGMASEIRHNGRGIFTGLPNPMQAGRYHSLAIAPGADGPLRVTAYAGDDVMAVQHRTYPVYGVQFHPESILTQDGLALIRNFTSIVTARAQRARRAA